MTDLTNIKVCVWRGGVCVLCGVCVCGVCGGGGGGGGVCVCIPLRVHVHMIYIEGGLYCLLERERDSVCVCIPLHVHVCVRFTLKVDFTAF